ncbi:FAD-binding oxidoreductase [Metallumcola ferriviriculae]|uniref:FAD-binding oxidoreductase n=1 Tax=Metallumcola ferriviriculae TaxID=3039180 RepID=A0AAU0UM21_9FIRM|nr:FAD-binding oxidoreductase [Desulfitibacteraceae bacterium MK1]
MNKAQKIIAKNAEEIVETVLDANEKGFALVPCGKGSIVKRIINLSDKKPPAFLSMEAMNTVEEFERNNLSITVQAGITLKELQDRLEGDNLFLPVTTENYGHRTVGSLVVENAAGYEQYAYGTIQDYILGLRFVTPYGELVKTGGKTVKNVSGYDFTRLFARSWGTLGIITSVTFKLRPLPEKRTAVIFDVTSLEQAIEIINEIIANKVSAATLRAYNHEGWKLVVGLAGFHETVDDHSERIRQIAQRTTMTKLECTKVNEFWQNYFADCPQSRFAIIGKGDKRVLTDMAVSLDREGLLKNAGFSEVDFGAGRLLINASPPNKLNIQQFIESHIVSQQPEKFIFNFQEKQPGLVYQRLKSALDPNRIMFPNNRLISGDSHACQ